MANVVNRLAHIVGDLVGTNPAALHATGQFAVMMIVARTKQGLDADRELFKPYTPAYAAVRRAHQLRMSPPDLVRTGHMLGALMSTVVGDEVTLKFASSNDALKASVNTATRDFFDIRDPDELDAIAEVYADALVGE